MKTDLVLTMDEYLNAWPLTPRVKAPAKDARHIPITGDIDSRNKEHSCRCDRWGHPRPNCLEKRKPRLCAAADELRL
jgi:hypothetical protein